MIPRIESEMKLIYKFFEEISSIPRCSGKEEKICNYLIDIARKFNLQYDKDDYFNVVIRKPGVGIYKELPVVALQSHIDMVCVKNENSKHNFDEDPIELIYMDNTLKANGTSLGADNGIGMAISLALLISDNIIHPPLEVIFTSNEEDGLHGVRNLDFQNIKSKKIINLDSENEGEIFVGCAGGIRCTIILDVNWENIPDGLIPYKVTLDGLKGGHSGLEIDKGRGNANILMGRFLYDLKNTFDYSLSTINGGSKMNVIPNKNSIILLLNKGNLDLLINKVEEWEKIFKNELSASDADVVINLEKYEENKDTKALSNNSKENLIFILNTLPNGIHTMSMNINDLVESSTNLGIVETTDNAIRFTSNVRSSKRSLMYHILNKMTQISKQVNAATVLDSEYPGWDYNPASELLDVFTSTYKELFNEEAKIKSMHAGLECGYFDEKIKDIEMISIGPNLYNVHSINEELDLNSVYKVWELLKNSLEKLK